MPGCFPERSPLPLKQGWEGASRTRGMKYITQSAQGCGAQLAASSF